MITPRKLAASLTLDGSGSGLVDLGSVAEGYSWDLRRMTIVPADLVTADTNAVLYPAVTTRSDSPAASDVIDAQTGVPYGFRWSRGTHVLRGQEHVLLIVRGGSAGAAYIVTAQVEEWASGSL